MCIILPRGIGWKRPERLPVGGEEWAKVAELDDKEYLENKRDKHCIKRKYSKLYLTKMPTGGDPSCPWSVRRAKSINKQIKRKCNITDEGNSDVESDEDDDDANDEEDYEDAKENEDDDADGEPAVGEPASTAVPNVLRAVSSFLVSWSSCNFFFINLVLLLCLGFQ